MNAVESPYSTSMLLSDFYDVCIKSHGQHIPDGLEIDLADFKSIIQTMVLPIVGKARPVLHNMFINVINSPYVFAMDYDGYVPDWISDVGIAMSNQASSIASVIPLMYRQDHRTRLWYYEKPKLYTFMFGMLMIQGAHYPYLQEVEYSAMESGEQDWEILDLDVTIAPTYAVDLASGYLLQALGKSRRVVNFSDFPITTDADRLVQEGQDLIDKTLGKISNKSAWWLSL
jgi:hypothetical protein